MRITLLGEYDDDLVARLRREHEVRVVPELDDRRVRRAVSDAALVVLRSPFELTNDVLADAPNLKWVIRAGSGTDSIASTHPEHGVEVFTTPLNSRSVAELVVAMTLALYRDLRPLHGSLQDGEWKKFDARGREILGDAIGILGFGRIGREVAGIASGLGMEIRAYDRSPDSASKRETPEQCDVTFTDLEPLLSASDVVAVCLPLNEDSRGLIDADALAHVQPGAVLVNVGRGEILDLDAVHEAVEAGRLGGVGLDVYPDEPPGRHPIFDLDAAICTPHVGAQTVQARARINDRIAELVAELHDRAGTDD
jgi:D-3-phosphoglycerate dehydrogenase